MTHFNPNPPEKPWVVLTMKRDPNNFYYPWFLELENHYFTPSDPGFRCYWHVNLNDERYDLSRARDITA